MLHIEQHGNRHPVRVINSVQPAENVINLISAGCGNILTVLYDAVGLGIRAEDIVDETGSILFCDVFAVGIRKHHTVEFIL